MWKFLKWLATGQSNTSVTAAPTVNAASAKTTVVVSTPSTFVSEAPTTLVSTTLVSSPPPKSKRKYTKRKVDDATVFVDEAVDTDLSAKGVDVDNAISSTLKKTSKAVKKSNLKLVSSTELLYNTPVKKTTKGK